MKLKGKTMKTYRNTATATKVVFVGLLLAPMQQAMADIIMHFGDNTNPASSFPSTLNSSAFTPGAEFRHVDPGGALGGGIPANKSNLSGNEAWIFDEMSGELTGVVNTDSVQGNSATVNSYIDMGYIPAGTCRNGCPGLFKSEGLLFGQPFEFVAPLPGTPEGDGNGPAILSITSVTTFEVHFPILETHWAGERAFLGLDQGAGVTFFCSGQPESSFRCTLEHTFTSSEDYNFSGWTLQMELSSINSATVMLNVAGGLLQECNSHTGNIVSLSSDITTSPGETVTSIDWLVDGISAGSGSNIQPTLSLGVHTIDVNVLTSDGVVTTNSQIVTIEDTTAPTVAPGFLNPFTGNSLTELTNRISYLLTSFNVSDTCDASPVVDGVLGKPAVDNELLTITKFQGSVRLQAESLNLKVFATDASGNIGVNEADLAITP
jgi:hypothetical protein